MLKRLLRISWTITKTTIKTSLILVVFLGLFNLNNKINLLSKIADNQYEELNYRYNRVINNEIELLKQIQEGFNKSNENLKLSEKYTVYEIALLRKTIKELSKNIYISEKTIKQIINSDVFVMGLFGQGAGTIIKKTDKNMYILTCAHIIDDIYQMNKRGFKLGVSIGYSKTDEKDLIAGLIVYGAEIIKYDEKNDLALLKTSIVDTNLNAVNLALEEPQKGDTVYSVGSPLGLYRTISKGIISNKLEGFYFSDNTTTYGNSGGGLYNIKGELVGVPSNVMGYKVAKKSNYERYLQDEEGKFIPETSLGLSINLFRIKEFLKNIEWIQTVAESATEILEILKPLYKD